MKNEQKLGSKKSSITRGAWSLNGEIDKTNNSHKVKTSKLEPKPIKQATLTTIKEKPVVTKEELIRTIRADLNNREFKRGVTYKELAKKYDVKEGFVFKINKNKI